MSKIILIGCGKAKAKKRERAADLYTGSLFAARRRYAEKFRCWRILSAEYGLVHPSEVIEPYDRDSLNPQPHFKDMTGWNRKAIGVVLPADASESLVHTAEQLMTLAATWPATVAEPAK